MKARNDEKLIDSLHEMWENIEENCNAKEHIGRVGHWLNYTHVQKVTCCAHCYEWGLKQHTNLYNEITGEQIIV